MTTMTDNSTGSAPEPTAREQLEAFEREAGEVQARLLHEIGARDRGLLQAIADAEKEIARLKSEQQRNSMLGTPLEPDFNSKMQAAVRVITDAQHKYKDVVLDREAVINGSHPGMSPFSPAIRNLKLKAAERERTKEEHEAAKAEFEKLITPEVEAAAKAKAAAQRLVRAARAHGVAPSHLASIVAGATAGGD